MSQFGSTSGRCGCFVPTDDSIFGKRFLPQVDAKVHTTILSSTSRTSLTQTFVNTDPNAQLKEVCYTFPIYDGVSVVSFTCTISPNRVIHGVVKEKGKAKRDYDRAVSQGQTAGLLEQSDKAADVFTTKLGNVPPSGLVKVDIVYLGELKHDAEVDGLRFTIPTVIAPRYTEEYYQPLRPSSTVQGKFSITIDAEMPQGNHIKTLQSPSHPIAVSVGTLSTAPNADPSFYKASATLALDSMELDKDFVLLVVASNLGQPTAIVETHPDLPNHRAIMTTLVPKFNIPAEKPEVVFVCDRSGSMSSKIQGLISALQLFLKSLPVGVKFNICSFGTHFGFLWERSQTYGPDSLAQAVKHVSGFSANHGGTAMYKPVQETFKRRYKDMNLEIFLLTDGEIWEQQELFNLINTEVAASKGAARVFALGVGKSVSHSLIEGIARAGRGFSQVVADGEQMDKKTIRMLKASLTPHLTDYTLEVKYKNKDDLDDEFELVERIEDALVIRGETPEQEQKKSNESSKGASPKKPISFYEPTDKDEDVSMTDSASADDKYGHLPSIDPPRYLQTPTDIPPLFPFSRASVYVILSDSTPEGLPESVVLRASSAHGPLELEIPVTVATEPATTIHQLAARQAIRELEEGRGWLSKAKNDSGALLKEVYEGRFSDMVEREAVRLGVKYKVAGKWTSFVAVEDDGAELGEIQVHEQSPLSQPTEQRAAAHLHRISTRRDVRMRMRTSAPSSSRSVPNRDRDRMSHSVFEALDFCREPDVRAAVEPAYAPVPRVSPFSSPSNFPMPPAPMSGSFEQQAARIPVASLLQGSSGHTVPAASLAGFSSPTRTVDKTPQDILQKLVSWQGFSGRWTATSELFSLISVSGDLYSQVPPRGMVKNWHDVLATVCVVVYLKKHRASDEARWEMLVDKAQQWLEGETGFKADELEGLVYEFV